MRSSFGTVELLATGLLASAGLGIEPPIPVFQLARRLGASRVAEADLGMDDGRLELEDDRIVITVRADMSLERKRFTAAHEIGHLLLARSDIDLSRVRREPPLHEDEAFCDRLAGSILMPAPWMRERYRGAPQELETLVDCAVSARVSLAAASVRLTRIGAWRRLALRWARGRSGWGITGATGYLGASLGTLRVTPATVRQLERVARAPGGRERTLVPLRSRGADLVFPGEVWVSGASAIALIDPTSPLPAAPGTTDLRSQAGRREAAARAHAVGST